MVPKFTAASVKFIRTLEGILVVASNVALLVVPIVTNALTASQAARDAVILNTAAVVSRSVLKAVMAIGGAYPPVAVPTAPTAVIDPQSLATALAAIQQPTAEK